MIFCQAGGSVRLWDNIACPFLPCLCRGPLDLCSSLSFLVHSARTWHLPDVHVEQAQCVHADSGGLLRRYFARKGPCLENLCKTAI